MIMRSFCFFCFFMSLAYADYNDFANKTYRKQANTLTIQIIRSTYPLDWSASRNLLWSILKNKYWFPKTKSTIGHVTAEVNCSLGGNTIRKFSGQSVKDLFDFRQKILEGYGFSILNQPHQYSELPLVTVRGRLNTEQEMYPRFSRQMARDNLSIFSFKLSHEQCLKAYSFMQLYEWQTQNTIKAGNIYGFGAAPEQFSGSGCAPYVQAVLRQAGLFDVAESMEQKVSVPKHLLGEPSRGKKVSVETLIRENYSLKGDAVGEHFIFSFPDPEVLYQFGLKAFHAGNTVLEKKKLGKQHSWYIMIDRSSQVDSPQQF